MLANSGKRFKRDYLNNFLDTLCVNLPQICAHADADCYTLLHLAIYYEFDINQKMINAENINQIPSFPRQSS